MTAGTLGVASAFAVLAYQAHAAEVAMGAAYNTALAQGRDAVVAEARVREMGQNLIRLGATTGESTAFGAAADLEKIRTLSDSAKASLVGVLGVYARVNAEGDLGKASEQVNKLFSSAETMRKVVGENRLLSGERYQQFEAALAPGATADQLRQAGDILAHGLVERYSRAQQEIEVRRRAMPYQALGVTPPKELVPHAVPGPLAPDRLTLPSIPEISANEAIAQGNRLQNERAAALAKAIQDQMAAGTVRENEAVRTGIQYWQERAADIQRQIEDRSRRGTGDPTEMSESASGLPPPRTPLPRKEPPIRARCARTKCGRGSAPYSRTSTTRS